MAWTAAATILISEQHMAGGQRFSMTPTTEQIVVYRQDVFPKEPCALGTLRKVIGNRSGRAGIRHPNEYDVAANAVPYGLAPAPGFAYPARCTGITERLPSTAAIAASQFVIVKVIPSRTLSCFYFYFQSLIFNV